MQTVLKQSLRGIVVGLCVWAAWSTLSAAQAQTPGGGIGLQPAVSELPETPGQLFTELPSNPDLERAANDKRVKRARMVAVNPAYVDAMLGASNVDADAPAGVAPDARRQVLNLFDDVNVPVVKTKQTRDSLGNIIWTGSVVGDPLGQALMVMDDGQLTGSITTNGRSINIMPNADGTHTVREMNPPPRAKDDARYHTEDDEAHDAPLSIVNDLARPAETLDRERPQAATTLHIYVVYTAKALARAPNMSSTVSLAMAHLNTGLSNSQIDVQAELVGLEQVSFNEGTGTEADDELLDAATDATGDFARIRLARAAARADLIAVIGSYGTADSCGIAWINETLTQNNISSRARLGVSLTDVTCLPATFTHEVGHNIGANHDRYVVDDDQPGPTEYNFGYVDTTARFMDVMAYNDQCDDLDISCTEINYFSNPNVNYQGRPTGIAVNQANAAHNARKIGEIAPLVAQFSTTLSTTSPTLAVFVNGTGTVTSSPAGINCGSTCSFTFSAGASVTLTATSQRGYRFAGWSGGTCSGTGTCTVTMAGATSVTATFVPALRLGSVFASTQPTSQSFLRFANTGSTAGTVSVVLADYTTGQTLGTWTSPSIPAGASLQSVINTIETAIPAGTAKPLYYSASVQSSMTGYIQHVLYRPTDGTLTNLSTCESGVTATPTQVANVHSSLLENGFPSSIAITNLARDDAAATLGIFDSTTGQRLGTYVTDTIRENAQAIVTVATIESATGIRPNSTQYHYTIKLEGSFNGALQHLVNNLSRGVITDMTTNCAFGSVTAPPSTVALRFPGPIFSSAQSGLLSFLRFYNTGTTAGTVNVTLSNSGTGNELGTWTSSTIQPGQSEQVQITTPETAAAISLKPQYYSTSLQTQITGYFQHVLYRPADGTLTNLSTCDAGVGAEVGQLINVHSSLLQSGFPSSIVVTNPTTVAATASLGVYDARNGTKLGTYTTPSIAANGQAIIPITAVEAQIGVTPNASQFHYVIKAEGTFNGFLQHLVDNKSVGVITDMTAMCQLPARAVRYNTCFPFACDATVGTSISGQLKREDYYENFRLGLTGQRSYTINVRGSSTGDGTLVQPYVFVYGPSGSVVAQGGGGGTGTNARLSFTPTSSGNYTVQVTAYVYDNNGGTFVLTVN
jgi:hypothetical protein